MKQKLITGPEDFYQEAMGHSFTHYVYDNNATYDDVARRRLSATTAAA